MTATAGPSKLKQKAKKPKKHVVNAGKVKRVVEKQKIESLERVALDFVSAQSYSYSAHVKMQLGFAGGLEILLESTHIRADQARYVHPKLEAPNLTQGARRS
jgi:hypothetical protein